MKKKVQYRTIQKKNLKLHDIKEGWQRVRLRFVDFFFFLNHKERIWEELTGQAGDNELEGKVQGSGWLVSVFVILLLSHWFAHLSY